MAQSKVDLLTLGACPKGYSSCLVCVCVCVSADEITFHIFLWRPAIVSTKNICCGSHE